MSDFSIFDIKCPEWASINEDGIWCNFCGELLVASFHADEDTEAPECCSTCGAPDDAEGYLSSPEYQDYITIAGDKAPAYLEGDLPDNAPPEFVQTFRLEQKARDMIALRGNRSNEKEPT